MDAEELKTIRETLATMVADGEEWLLPWVLKVEDAEASLKRGAGDLERIKAMGAAAKAAKGRSKANQL